MKALQLTEYNHLEMVDVPKPEPGEKEVLIKVAACGICGSDVHGVNGSTGRRIPPIIMGHEATGVIEELGPGIKNYKVGDRVAFDSTILLRRMPLLPGRQHQLLRKSPGSGSFLR